jgi:3-dehydroquinate dehydratase-2
VINTDKPGQILVINGPNLNLLGTREPEIYGDTALIEIESEILTIAEKEKVKVEFFQSNHEGEIIDKIQAARDSADFIIINPAALGHYSIALYDVLKAVDIPFIEVHLSNIYAREPFRQKSLLSPIASGIIAGLGSYGYKMAFLAACHLIKNHQA